MRALVIGDSGGIGAAVAARLRSAGGDVVGLSRQRNGLDVTQPASVDAALNTYSEPFDLIFMATGALVSTRAAPEKSLRDVSAEEMMAQYAVNAVAPALVLRHVSRLMARRQRGVFAALSARVGSIGDNRAGGWYAYRASKAALNQVIKTAAIELARSHRDAVCVALHPGTVATRFTANFPKHDKVDAGEAAQDLLRVLGSLTADDSGGFFDYSGARVPW